jgi:hypothetical protein
MTKLTRRKLWVGIGAVTIAGTAAGSGALAQGVPHTGHAAGQPPPAPAKGEASSSAAEGGEAYLTTDGGPADTRIRFYRDVALMRGHLLVGRQLIELNLWDEALPHFLHPTEELYGGMEKYIKLHRIPPFRRELQALAQAVKAKRKGAYEQAVKAVDQRLGGALDIAKRYMSPFSGFTARSAAEVLKVAVSEYGTSLEDGRFVKPVEYQDSRGFVWEAERMLEAAAPELDKVDAEALGKVRHALATLKRAWPAAMPPPSPILQPGEISALVSDIELHTSRF